MTKRAALIAASVTITAPAFADDATAQSGSIASFNPRPCSKADQFEGNAVVCQSAEPYKGMEINVTSETLTVHDMNRRRWPRPSRKSPGIKVKHDIIQEGDVVEKIQTQMPVGQECL